MSAYLSLSSIVEGYLRLDWLTAPSTDIPHISADVIAPLCQTRQIGF
jgi:hypothetical protein